MCAPALRTSNLSCNSMRGVWDLLREAVSLKKESSQFHSIYRAQLNYSSYLCKIKRRKPMDNFRARNIIQKLISFYAREAS